MSTFINMPKVNQGQNTATETLLAQFVNSYVGWVPRGAIYDATRVYGAGTARAMAHHFHRLCSVTELTNATGELQNEREVREAGKSAGTANDGFLFSQTITFKGDDVYTVAALLGLNLNNSNTSAVTFLAGLKYGQVYTDAGDIVIQRFNSNGNVTGGVIIPEVTVRLLDVPGVVDTEATITVNLETKKSPIQVGNGALIVPFIFLDDGTVTNTAAPDGTITAFALKNANEAYGAGSAPSGNHSFLRVDDLQSDWSKYLPSLRVGGETLGSSDVTINADTATITFGTAPVDGAKITGIAVIPSGAPDYDATKVYSAGDVVKASDGDYYVATAAPGSEVPSGSATDWTAADIPAAPYWGTSPGSDTIAKATHPMHPGTSWLDFNLLT